MNDDTLPDNFFRSLDEKEITAFEQSARDNYEVGTPISGLWHPIYRVECMKMNAEAE